MRLLLPLLLFLLPVMAAAQNGICLDGFTDDWTTATTITDPAGDGTAYDILSLSVYNDSANLYIKFELAQELNLQENNYLNLYIDTDHNAATGNNINGLGVEFNYAFGLKVGDLNGTMIRQDDIGLISLPTHSSSTFELAIARDRFPNGVDPLFPGDTIRIILKDEFNNGDAAPNMGGLTYVFQENIPTTTAPVPLEKEDTSLLRVMNYNILADGPLEPGKQATFTRILHATGPDIILFNEFFSSTAAQVKSYLDNNIPLGTVNGWYTVKMDQGNVTASRYPILQSWAVAPGYRLTASLIDVDSKLGEDILVVNGHMRCCSNDPDRQLEADALASFFQDIKTPGGLLDLPEGTPFLLAGDLNLVGDRQQLKTILEGDIVDTATFGTAGMPDWDGSALTDLVPVHTEYCAAYTWRADYSLFAPGRLDYMIYTGSALTVEKSYILDTERMSGSELAKYQLNATDSEVSDHLPIITDLRLKEDIGIKEPDQHGRGLKIYPNPAADGAIYIHASGYLPLEVEIYDLQGRQVHQQQWTDKAEWINISPLNLQSGIYFIQVYGRNMMNTAKLIIGK